MKASTLNEVKKELNTLEPAQVLELCMRIAKYKKDNKELLSYLLFEANDEQGYIDNIKGEIDEQFKELPKPNLYLTKKSLRKILKIANKYIRYSGIKETELEVRIHFCKKLKKSGIPINTSLVLANLYQMQIKKIKMALAKLHEDIRFDYVREIEGLTESSMN